MKQSTLCASESGTLLREAFKFQPFALQVPRIANFFKDKLILFCGDQDTFVRFWERTCSLAGANTRVVNEEDLNVTGAIALVTDWDCPHEVQNKANEDNIPIVSTTWVVQCLIEGRVLAPGSNVKFSFLYTDPEWSWDFRKYLVIRENWHLRCLTALVKACCKASFLWLRLWWDVDFGGGFCVVVVAYIRTFDVGFFCAYEIMCSCLYFRVTKLLLLRANVCDLWWNYE